MNRLSRSRRAPYRGLVLLALAVSPVLSGCSRSAADLPPPDAPVPVRVADVPHKSVAAADPRHRTARAQGRDHAGLQDRRRRRPRRRGRRRCREAGGHAGVPGTARDRCRRGPRPPAAGKADRDLARAQRLFADSVATREQVQDAETAAEVAGAAREAAEFDRRYAVITAPADGVVLRRWSEPGEVVSPGDAVLQVGNKSRGSVVRVGLADRDVARVHVGDPATVRFDVRASQPVEGTVRRIPPPPTRPPARSAWRSRCPKPGG